MIRRTVSSITAVAALSVAALCLSLGRAAPPIQSAEATNRKVDLPPPNAAPSADKPDRLREGTRLEKQQGYFQLTGDRATFVTSDGQRRFGCLENLNLERIAQAVADNPDRLEWTITGEVTEYRGSNCLLISHAVLNSRRGRASAAP